MSKRHAGTRTGSRRDKNKRRKKEGERKRSLLVFPGASGLWWVIGMMTPCSIFLGLGKKYGKNWSKTGENACLDLCSQTLPLCHLRQAQKLVGWKINVFKQGTNSRDVPGVMCHFLPTDLRQRANGGSTPSRSNSGWVVWVLSSTFLFAYYPLKISVDVCRQCRVQVKLPGGGSTIFSLTATDTVAALRKMIAGVSPTNCCVVSFFKRGCHCHAHLCSQHMCDSEENITLTCTYPRRDLMSEGDSQTLAQVGLSPTGVVIARLGKVCPRKTVGLHALDKKDILFC